MSEEKEFSRISEADRNTLGLLIVKKELAYANVETAIAKQENIELSYKYFINQLYIKYNLNPKDQLTHNGDIIKAIDESKKENDQPTTDK